MVVSMRLVGEALAALELRNCWTRRTPWQLPRVELHHPELRGRLCLTPDQTQQAREL